MKKVALSLVIPFLMGLNAANVDQTELILHITEYLNSVSRNT